MTTWRDKQNCRTCKYAEANELQRRYSRKNQYGFRCLYASSLVEMPKMPSCMFFHSLQKSYIHLGDPDCGANCPVWEKWQ